MSHRRGFTLVELLVVIAIIGMLVAMLLPAVNSAREQGRLTTCKNNLHQLSTACLAHVEKLGAFPSGGWGSNWVGLPDQGSGVNQPGGWIYQILPFMDNSALHDLGQGTGNPKNQTPANVHPKLISTPVAVLYCPTRRTARAYQVASPLAAVSQGNHSDYAANGGSVRITPGQSPTSAPAPNFVWPDLTMLGFNGIVAMHSVVTMEGMTGVPDNKDTCYLIGEKYMSSDSYTNGLDPGDKYSAMSGDDVSLIRWGASIPAMDRSANNNPPPNPTTIFGSSHSAGWNAAFVGGNVQLIGWGIDPTTHAAMSTRNGHEVIDPTKIPK